MKKLKAILFCGAVLLLGSFFVFWPEDLGLATLSRIRAEVLIGGVITVTAGSYGLFKLWSTPDADVITKLLALVILAILIAIVFGVRALFGWMFS